MPHSHLALPDLYEGEFGRRRAQARRSGNPAWLWPEVAAEDWAAALSDITQAVSSILRGEPARLSPCDPRALSLAGYTSGTGPLLGWWIKTGDLQAPGRGRAVLARHLGHARERSRRASARASSVARRFARRSIPMVILKGGHCSLAYFPDPATRPSADLDLLVPGSQATLAEASLKAAGFCCAGRSRGQSSWNPSGVTLEPRSLWLSHADDPWSVDLHSSLDFSPGPGARTVFFDKADPFQGDDHWPPESRAKVLRQPLLCLHLAVHAGGELQSLTLLRMIELVFVIRRDSREGRFSWSEFLELGELTGGLGPAYPALAMSEKLAGGTIPQPVLHRCRDAAPARVRAIVDKLEPATAQRVDRMSIGEHFMWVAGVAGWARQLRSDFIPDHSLRSIYQARGYQLIRGSISR